MKAEASRREQGQAEAVRINLAGKSRQGRRNRQESRYAEA
jgi:hypothetical protein